MNETNQRLAGPGRQLHASPPRDARNPLVLITPLSHAQAPLKPTASQSYFYGGFKKRQFYGVF